MNRKLGDIMRAVIYIRVSTEEQATEGYSLVAQESKLRELATSQGYKIIKVYADEGISGKTITKRKALLKLLEDAKQKLFDMVFIFKLDRLSRSVKDSYSIIDELIKSDVGLISYQDKDIKFETATQRAMFGFTTVLAQLEVEQTSERVTFTMKELFEKEKKWLFGRLPYGYKFNENREIVIVEEQAKIVKRIYEMYNSGKGQSVISSQLNMEGVKPPSAKGIGWWDTSIQKILTSSYYYGDYIANFKRSKKPIIVTGIFPPIISKEEFEKAKKIREIKNTLHPQVARMSGDVACYSCVLVCADCGQRINAYGWNKDKTMRRYRCVATRHRLCSASSFLEDKIETAFLKEFENLKSKHENEEINLKFKSNKKNEIEILKKELFMIKKKIEKNYYAWENDMIDDEFYMKRSTELKNEENEIKKKINESSDVDSEKLPKILTHIPNFKTAFTLLNRENKKKFLMRFVDHIVVKVRNGRVIIVKIEFK